MIDITRRYLGMYYKTICEVDDALLPKESTYPIVVPLLLAVFVLKIWR